MNDSCALTPEEATALLEQHDVGRVAFCTADGPAIVPLNYGVVRGDVIVRTVASSGLVQHGGGAVVAFEVDFADDLERLIWSIQVRGYGEVISDAATITEIRRTWEPRPWADGSRETYFRIQRDQITG